MGCHRIGIGIKNVDPLLAGLNTAISAWSGNDRNVASTARYPTGSTTTCARSRACSVID